MCRAELQYVPPLIHLSLLSPLSLPSQSSRNSQGQCRNGRLVTPNTTLLMGGRLVGGGPCSETEVNDLPLPGPQREARLQWETSVGSHSQAAPSFPWFCPDPLGISWANGIKPPPPPLLLRGPAQVPEQPGWSCHPQPHPAPPRLPVLHAPRSLFLCGSWHLLGPLTLPLVSSAPVVHSAPGRPPLLDT